MARPSYQHSSANKLRHCRDPGLPCQRVPHQQQASQQARTCIYWLAPKDDNASGGQPAPHLPLSLAPSQQSHCLPACPHAHDVCTGLATLFPLRRSSRRCRRRQAPPGRLHRRHPAPTLTRTRRIGWTHTHTHGIHTYIRRSAQHSAAQLPPHRRSNPPRAYVFQQLRSAPIRGFPQTLNRKSHTYIPARRLGGRAGPAVHVPRVV